MGAVQKLAEKVKEGLQTALPKLRKTVVNKLALAVGAMIEAQTPNMIELVNVIRGHLICQRRMRLPQ